MVVTWNHLPIDTKGPLYFKELLEGNKILTDLILDNNHCHFVCFIYLFVFDYFLWGK
jgi:hypothetical protein